MRKQPRMTTTSCSITMAIWIRKKSVPEKRRAMWDVIEFNGMLPRKWRIQHQSDVMMRGTMIDEIVRYEKDQGIQIGIRIKGGIV